MYNQLWNNDARTGYSLLGLNDPEYYLVKRTLFRG